jgi:hypothetical protein
VPDEPTDGGHQRLESTEEQSNAKGLGAGEPPGRRTVPDGDGESVRRDAQSEKN